MRFERGGEKGNFFSFLNFIFRKKVGFLNFLKKRIGIQYIRTFEESITSGISALLTHSPTKNNNFLLLFDDFPVSVVCFFFDIRKFF